MIEGLQGTMITGEEALMTAERLIIILNDAGTIMTDAETTEDAKKKMNATTKGLQGMRTGKRVGLVELFLLPGTGFAAVGFGRKQTGVRWWFASILVSSLLVLVFVYADRVLL